LGIFFIFVGNEVEEIIRAAGCALKATARSEVNDGL